MPTPSPGAAPVGFAGLGTMGEPMAARLARAGHRLSVLDLRAEPVRRLAALGAHPAGSARELAARSEIVLLALVDDAQVERLLLGEGLLAGLAAGSVVVVHSTVRPATCERLAARCAERRVGFLDAPVTGGPAGAAAGALTLLVGGAREHLDACRPVFRVLGERVFHLGGPGRGAVAKVANNVALATTLQAVHEAVELGRAQGLPATTLLEILRSGAGDSWVARNWAAIGASSRDYPGGVTGVAELTGKDLAIAGELAERTALDLPVTRLTARRLAQAYQGAADHRPEGAHR